MRDLCLPFSKPVAGLLVCRFNHPCFLAIFPSLRAGAGSFETTADFPKQSKRSSGNPKVMVCDCQFLEPYPEFLRYKFDTGGSLQTAFHPPGHLRVPLRVPPTTRFNRVCGWLLVSCLQSPFYMRVRPQFFFGGWSPPPKEHLKEAAQPFWSSATLIAFSYLLLVYLCLFVQNVHVRHACHAFPVARACLCLLEPGSATA